MTLAQALLGLALLMQAEPTDMTAAPQPPAAPALAPDAAEAPPAQQAPVTAVRLAKGSELRVELANGVSSITSKLGDRFPIRLVEPIKASDGTVIVPAGAMGEGEVIDAARSGMNGQQGKLVISARFLVLNGVRVRIRGMSLIASGESRVDLSTAVAFVPYVGLASFLIRGGDVQFPTGMHATVKVAEDLDIAIAATAAPEGSESSLTLLLGAAAITQDAAPAPEAAPAAAAEAAPAPEAVLAPDGALATETPAAAPEAAASEKGKIVFFRPWRLSDRAYTYWVVETGDDGKSTKETPRLAGLPNGGAYALEVEPGVHSFNIRGPMADNRAEDRLRMDVEAGETYYVEQTVRMGLVTGGFQLVPADEARFKASKVDLGKGKKPE